MLLQKKQFPLHPTFYVHPILFCLSKKCNSVERFITRETGMFNGSRFMTYGDAREHCVESRTDLKSNQ